MARQLSEKDRAVADAMRKRGYPNTADYIEMFGSDNMNPWFWKGPTKQSDEFYKQCVAEKRPWNYYAEEPEKDAIL